MGTTRQRHEIERAAVVAPAQRANDLRGFVATQDESISIFEDPLHFFCLFDFHGLHHGGGNIRVVARRSGPADFLYLDHIAHLFSLLMHFMMYNSSVIGFSLWMQSMKTVSCIRQSFRKLNFTALAKQSGFRERSRKISPLNFVLALLAMASKGALSLGKEARLIGFLANREQAVQCAKKATAFMTLVLMRHLKLMGRRAQTA